MVSSPRISQPERWQSASSGLVGQDGGPAWDVRWASMCMAFRAQHCCTAPRNKQVSRHSVLPSTLIAMRVGADTVLSNPGQRQAARGFLRNARGCQIWRLTFCRPPPMKSPAHAEREDGRQSRSHGSRFTIVQDRCRISELEGSPAQLHTHYTQKHTQTLARARTHSLTHSHVRCRDGSRRQGPS